MSQLGNTLGSTEALAGSGRNSRTLFVSSSVDDILDKLLFLGYSDTPLSRYYFQVADKNPNEQLFVFASLVTWLLRRLDVKDYEAPGQFDDPNVTCANIVNELKKLGIPFDYGPIKLKQAYGEACLYVLQSLVDMIFINSGSQFHQPIHKDEYPEEADVDHNAEVTIESMEEVEANEDEEEMYHSKTVLAVRNESPIEALVDPGEWRLEVERVTPLLKVNVASDSKDWRLHLNEMDHHLGKINTHISSTDDHLDAIVAEIDQGLEKILSREKYINSQFEKQISSFKKLSIQASDYKHRYNVTSTNVTNFTSELTQISEDLESVKSRMDDLGSGMTDAKPLMAIKQGSIRIKADIKQMDLRIGVIESSLLHVKLKRKELIQG